MRMRMPGHPGHYGYGQLELLHHHHHHLLLGLLEVTDQQLSSPCLVLDLELNVLALQPLFHQQPQLELRKLFHHQISVLKNLNLKQNQSKLNHTFTRNVLCGDELNVKSMAAHMRRHDKKKRSR